MSAIDSLLKRFGFVRLSRYGMVLTPEGRIITLRPEILDDGMGSKVVGWLDHDLAAAELAHWPVKPAPQKAVASRVAAVPPKIPAVVRIPPVPTGPTPIVTIPPVAVVVAPAAEEEEDDWEWEIALARARTAAEDTEAVVAALMAPKPVATAKPAPRRTRPETVPPPPRETQPPPPKFIAAKTLPMGTPPPALDEYTQPTREVARVTQQTAAVAPPPERPRLPRAKSPETIIPVPKLPRITNAHVIQPVVSTPTTPRTRFAKATPQPQRAALSDNDVTSTGIPLASRKKTVEMPAPIRPAEDDRTRPNVPMPHPSNVVALPRIPSIKRTAAR